KRNETIKDDDERVRMNPFIFYEQEGFGTLSSFTGEQLGSLIDDFGEENVLEAMKTTRLNGSKSLNYTKKILTDPKPKENSARSSKQIGKVRSLFDPSRETVKRQQEQIEKYRAKEIDMTGFPYLAELSWSLHQLFSNS